MEPQVIDLTRVPQGDTYENTYGAWMGIFRQVAESSEDIVVVNPPTLWIPLLVYLGADIQAEETGITEPEQLRSLLFAAHGGGRHRAVESTLVVVKRAIMQDRLRELVQMFEGARPELVDALYKSDKEWATVNRCPQRAQNEFIVAGNGAFQRPEVLDYMERLRRYTGYLPVALMLPCAADKPYPSVLHKRAKQTVEMVIGHNVERVIFTGTLGYCPEAMWDEMPHYDSGMPNQWRLQEMTRTFLPRQPWKVIVVYGDFYNHAVCNGLRLRGATEDGTFVVPDHPEVRAFHTVDGQLVVFVNEIRHYDEYLDLLADENLARLYATAKYLRPTVLNLSRQGKLFEEQS